MLNTGAHTFSVGDEASVHDVPIQTVCVSERTTSGHQITSLSKHEAFNRCETRGPGLFHTTESQLTQKNSRQRMTVQKKRRQKKKEGRKGETDTMLERYHIFGICPVFHHNCGTAMTNRISPVGSKRIGYLI